MKTSARVALALLLPVIPLVAQENAAASPKIGSTVFHFEKLAVKPTGVGERRDVSNNPTATVEVFECHISTLNPANASHPPHTHPQEELIVLRDGSLDVHINGKDTRVGPGSLFFFASNVPHAVQNHGDKPATYFVFNFATAKTRALRNQPAVPQEAGKLWAHIFPWESLQEESTKVGSRRAITDSPTATLENFEAHVTTLKGGEAPHAPHRHPDEEIVLVREGQLDVTIEGKTERAGPGSIIFVSSGDLHGWKNAGDTAASYYVFRLKTEKTPAASAP